MRDTLKVITVRVPSEVLDKLPSPSLEGHRAAYIREAIEEKIDRDEKRQRREAKAAAK